MWVESNLAFMPHGSHIHPKVLKLLRGKGNST